MMVITEYGREQVPNPYTLPRTKKRRTSEKQKESREKTTESEKGPPASISLHPWQETLRRAKAHINTHNCAN